MSFLSKIKPSFNNRTKRYLSLWLISVAKVLAVIIAAGSIGGLMGYLIIKATYAFGAEIVISAIALTWAMAIATMIGSILASDKLCDLEKKEAKVMRRLRSFNDR